MEADGRRYAGESAASRMARRRAAFVQAGLQLFGTHLYGEVSIADLLAAAGQTRRSFYELFADREELLRVVEDEEVTGRVLAAMARSPLPRDLPESLALLDRVIDFYEEDPRRAHIAFVAVVGVSPQMESHRRRQFDLLAGALSETASAVGGRPVSRLSAVGFLGAFSQLMSDHLWRPDSSMSDVRTVLHQSLRLLLDDR